MKPTVHDIARNAGVSLATVDRVLNERSGVSARTRERVMETMQRLGYVRDMGAANLARGRQYRFDFILPDNENTFILKLRTELAHAAERSLAERVVINLVLVPAFNETALVAALDASLQRNPDGVAFVAIDTEPVKAACERLGASGVPVITLISDLSQSVREHYVGIDNNAAGRTAARLLGLFANGTKGRIAILSGSMQVRDHCERFDGFVSAMQADFPDRVLLPVLEGRDDDTLVENLIRDLLKTHNDIAGIYSLGAGNTGLLRALSAHQGKSPLVIAHENDAATCEGLKQGLVHGVLAQDAGHEIRSAIRILKASVDRQPIIAGQEHIRIEIFLKDNLPQ